MVFVLFQMLICMQHWPRKLLHQYINHSSHLFAEMIFRCGPLEKHKSNLFYFPVTSSQPLSSIRLGNRFSVWRDVFTVAVSSLQASRTFNKIACEETGREMMETPVDRACHCGRATSISNAKGFDPGLVIRENLIGGKKMPGIWNVRGTVAELEALACS